jgi:hypothetical protein
VEAHETIILQQLEAHGLKLRLKQYMAVIKRFHQALTQQQWWQSVSLSSFIVDAVFKRGSSRDDPYISKMERVIYTQCKDDYDEGL